MLSGWRCGARSLAVAWHASARQLSGAAGPQAGPPQPEDGGQLEYSLVQERRGRQVSYRVAGSPSHGFVYSQAASSRPTSDLASGTTGDTGVIQGLLRHSTRLLNSTLLPVGYPNTVGSGYWGYVAWQGLTNFTIAANTVLASTFLLYAVGLGTGAIPTAGALNWVLKDGLGQLGTLVFGKIIAHNFDIHSKSWYFLSMMILKLATGVEILTVLLPQHFLVLGSLANSLKGVAFMANSSTRSVFNLSFARDNNIADITAKGTSQYICASMFGTVAGATLCTWVGQDSTTALVCYTILTLITLYGGYATVKTIPLSTLNSTRLQLLCESYLCAISAAAESKQLARRAKLASAFGTASLPASSLGVTPAEVRTLGDDPMASLLRDGDALGVDSSGQMGGHAVGWQGGGFGVQGQALEEKVYDECLDPQLPSPGQLATEDPPLPFLMGDQRLLDPAIIVGEALERVLDDTGPELMVVLMTTYRLSHAIVLPRGAAVHILLHQQASQRDICQAFLQGCLLRRRMRSGSMVGLAATQHAIQVLEAQRSAEARKALIETAAALEREHDTAMWGGSTIAAGGKDASTDMTPDERREQHGPDESYGDLCAVKGSTSPALAELRIVLQDTLQTAERLTSPFMRCLEASGWKLEKVVVEAEKRRMRW